MKSDNVFWLATASISSSIEIGPAQVLAIKAGLALPWNKLRLLRRYDIINAAKVLTDFSGGLNSSAWLVRKGCVSSPATLWVITSKENLPPFTLPGGDEIKGAPLVYVPHLVDKVVHFLNENER